MDGSGYNKFLSTQDGYDDQPQHFTSGQAKFVKSSMRIRKLKAGELAPPGGSSADEETKSIGGGGGSSGVGGADKGGFAAGSKQAAIDSVLRDSLDLQPSKVALKYNAKLLSTDIVRTKNKFDSSANLLNPSQGEGESGVPSAFQDFDNDVYSRPSDRIARFYTKTSVGLTMKHATKIVKEMISNPALVAKVVGLSISATAPDAFHASERIKEAALSETGQFTPKQRKVESLKPLPNVGSPLSLREEHRLLRSEPMYTIKNPRVVDKKKKEEVGPINFDNWDPESIDAGSGSADNMDSLTASERVKLHGQAAAKFFDVVKVNLRDGILTSAGSGHRLPVVTINVRNVESIISKLQSKDGIIEDPLLQELLKNEMAEVQSEYLYAASRASVEYDIKYSSEAAALGISLSHLMDTTATHLWTNREYQIPEWRVLRRTSIQSKNILRIFRTINAINCNALSIVLDLQNLWQDGHLPTIFWENVPSVARCTFANLLFIDVNQPQFRQKLPMALDDFVTHIENHSKDVREALMEYWLVTAVGKISNFISNLADSSKTLNEVLGSTQNKSIADNDDESAATAAADGESTAMFDRFKQREAQKMLNNRTKMEGLDQSRGGNKKAVMESEYSRNKAERVVDTSVVLMSKQLRGMCESSLQSLTFLFENVSKPLTAPYSVFVVHMRMRKKKSREVTMEFNEPVEVCLQPDISDFKAAMTNCIHATVSSSRNFNRPEQTLGHAFGGANNYLLADMQQRCRHKKMNEASVNLADTIVQEITQRIHAQLADKFEAPAKLLDKFAAVEDILSGKEADVVFKSISANIGANASSTVDGLEALSAVCKHLEKMMEMIKTIVPDVQYFPLFEVRCNELKEQMLRYVKQLHNYILEAILEENRAHLLSISSKYQDIANTLISDVSDSAELRALQEFTNKAAVTLGDLYEQYTTQSYERVKFLLANKFKLSRDDVSILYNAYNWPLNIQAYLKRSYESQSSRKRELEELLEEDQRKLETDINDISKRVELLADNSNPMDFRKMVERIVSLKRDIETKQQRAEEILERETLLEVPHTDHPQRLEEIKNNVDPLDRLWTTVKSYVEKTHTWHESPIAEIDAEDAERTAEDLYRVLLKLGKEFEKLGDRRTTAKSIADRLQVEVKEFIAESIPLMLLICNPGMRERHWADIEAITGLAIPKGEIISVSMMIDVGLQNETKKIEDICVSASKEYGLQIALDKMEAEWKPMNFETKEYRTSGTRILCGIDEIQQLLDDQIVKTQAMRGSRYIKPFIEQITIWEATLVSMQDILDNWLKVQSTWLYLEPIFSSDDIMRQMPTEGKMFRAVDNTWRVGMSQTFAEPSCVKVARRAGFLQSLIDANEKLEQIQKGLNDYLETKRLAFPRFFFLSNDELLEILAETKDPLRVQPHLKKCFDGIAKLHFQPNLDITACYDPKNEKLDFPYDKIQHKKINPNDSNGNVERWLIEVESVMKKSLAYATDVSMKDCLQSDRIEWLYRWQGQVIICCNQTRWSSEVEKLFSEGATLGEFYSHLCEELLKTVMVVRGDISKQLRIAIGSLVVMDVHNRDTVNELWQLNVTAKTDFDWLAQLRYYWNPAGESALSGKPGSIQCRMINAMVLYAYEYIGNQDRLVITPLTDRCYRTLMGAIHLNLGGAPEGPAGTGKTETTKDLAKAIAIQCVVTNCSDGLDYLAMAKFFKGLASSGSWACFDEFNRIQLEVLSVIAQQIMQIQLAKMKQVAKFTFEGTELELKPTCCPFITMNPGYAGRAELPDNLKVLFRTVAMMVPDYAMIAEIILYSFGYTSARALSVKIVTTYKLCSEQLSSQSHYDYGMRAVISVLRAAGNLKRAEGQLPEDVLVLRSIIDVNLPKFLSPDVPLFGGITSDLFPGVNIDPPDRDNMKQAFIDVCQQRSLIPEDYFWDKIVQIYDMMVVRHGFMIVGLPFSGKSSAWKVLGDVLGLLSERFPNDKRWSKVYPILQNPKSITMGQLYGMFDPVSHEWTDGVLAINYRNAAQNKMPGVGENDRKWILFDGPVDALWIENMNTVLDDNKKLCLMSGEIIAMTEVMSMMFEPMDLLVASPATVSRCGMVYMEPERLGWKPLLTTWIETFKKGGKFNKSKEGDEYKFQLFENDANLIKNMFEWLVDPCLCWVRRECVELSPTVDSNLVMSLLNILEALMIRVAKKYLDEETKSHEVEPADAKLAKQRQTDIECCFFFALVWSVGKTGTADSQKKFSKYLDSILTSIDTIEAEFQGIWNALQLRNWKKPNFQALGMRGSFILPMPVKIDFYDCVYIPEDGKWKPWVEMLGNYVIAPGTPYGSIVVPNSYTAQYQFMLETLVPQKRNVLMCAPTGTGKSAYVLNVITNVLSKEKFKPLCLGFSAKTSANMTQEIIDGKLDKRRKGVYGPPMGQQSIIFVDDLNMPEVEFYGAQPPIELLRQLIDNGGWYDLKEKVWKTIIDTCVVSAMGPPGGGRNFCTPRLLRHFSLFCFADFDDQTLRRIFTTIVSSHLSSLPFSSDVKNCTEAVVEATLDTYRSSVAFLLPTPQKSHYTFNLRDYSRIIQGVLLSKPSDSFNKPALIRLWCHEAIRVFGDRLIDDADRDWFKNHLESMVTSKFNSNFYEVMKLLDLDNKKSINVNDMRRLIFADFMSTEDPKPYTEVQDAVLLNRKVDEFLADFNMQSRKPMDLVMFSFAIEHISRISRILKMPGGNALLVGVGGSGRQSLSRLAAFIMGYTLFQIEISKNYTNLEWREDLKSVLRSAGTSATPMTFLFSDTQIKNETFVEDINNMLNNGEVPNIFPSDERAAIAESVRPFAKQVFGKVAVDMNTQDLYSYFITRVKSQLHIVLAFSPIGDAFRERLRKFPALINCCTIDWFTAWPGDALFAVAQRFLADIKFDSDQTRTAIVLLCQKFHQDVVQLSSSYLLQLRRRNYVTPTSYLELIMAFKQNLDVKRVEVSTARVRYEVGLEKLAFAAEQVNKMQKQLEDLQPELKSSAIATEVLMGQIEEKMPGVMETRKVVSAEAAIAQGEADVVQGQKDSVEADLAEAIPALEAAVEALNTIKPSDINEIKALSKPPEKIKMCCKAVCVMLDIKPARIPDPNDPSKRIMDFWGPSQKMLSDSGFIASLMNYDKDNMNPKIIAEVKKEFIEGNEDFKPEIIAKASKAAEGMCRWVMAMITYDRVAKIVGPKKAALAEAEATLKVTMDALNAKKAALKKVEDELGLLEKNLQEAKTKKQNLEAEANLCDQKIIRANQLLDGLGGERDRWSEFAKMLTEKFRRLTGDVLISAGVLAYLGPFTAVFRQKQMISWVAQLKEAHIPCSDSPSLTNTLGDLVKIRQWNIDGLPTDGFSVDNGIVVFSARRWPLMIDPQGQANKWLRNMEKSKNLQVIKLTDGNYLRTLENSIQFGFPVLLENVLEELDPSLEPLLQKQIFKQGGVNCIRLGDATIEYSDSFRFYITTKLRNPHYLPEVSVKVTLLNFMITPEGLQDQLLGIVVSQERPDLEEQRNQLIVESADNKRQLKEIEDKILYIMSSSSGNILEDETAITTLKSSKSLSDDIGKKQAIAEETEININNVRMSYSPCAFSSQILFFCIADLANIEPVYQYSLSWFINLFISSIRNSEKGRDVAKRLENLDAHFTYSLYRNICRSLLEKDKLLFSFLLASRIMGGRNALASDEWFYLLTGGLAMNNTLDNPAPDWLGPKNWDAIVRLSQLEHYKWFAEDFKEHVDEWKVVYDSLTPQDCEFPGKFAEITGIGRLCALRTIRSDKVVLAVQRFVGEYMGEKYVKPPPFDLQACYADSSATIPLVFILSAGSDPMGAVFRAAEVLKTTVDPISLGQGQGPKAVALIQKATQKGTWVVLQNCHLAPSWMTTLEKTCEDLDPEVVHKGFRLWCTTYPSEVFPVAVLQNGVKMTNAPPKGIRANLIGSFNMDPIGNEDWYGQANEHGKGVEFRKLVFGLCFFHAVIQERRLYGPLGWNIPYEFNESDLRISVHQLQSFLIENNFVPYKALIYTAGECNYGGRVTDDKDRRTLMCLLTRFYQENFLLEENHQITPSGLYCVPPDGSREDYIAFIEKLPLVAPPEVFGMHDNATLTKDQNDTMNLLNSIVDAEGGGGGGGGGGASKDDVILNVAGDIASKLQENYDMEFAQLKYPVRWEESMNTVLCQELIRFNNLLSLMRDTLKNIQKAVKGLVVMSSELEVLGNALFVNRIPLLWKARSYPSLKPLSSYVTDQHTRLSFFNDWLNVKPPSTFWISGFFFTQAFLTGASQNFARKYTIPIDDVVFDFVMKKEFPSIAVAPENGVYTQGLFLEGARWDKDAHAMAESLPKVLFSLAPLMHWMPYRKADLPVYPHYKCPVYKTSDRRGVLATTGHSSNFVCMIYMPTEKQETHWVQRGVAMLTQLDD